MSITELVGVFRTRWKSLVAVAMLCLVAGGVLAVVQTPMYASTTQLFVSTAVDSSVESYQGSLYSVQRVKSYEQLARSIEVARSVVDELGLDDDPSDVQDQVTAAVVPDTTVVAITIADPDPEQARTIARGYASVLVDTISALETPEGQTQSLVKVEVIDDAELPASPYAPNLMLRLFIALFVGLLLGAIVAVLRHLVDNKVRDPQQAAEMIRTTLLSVIGRFDRRGVEGEQLHEGFRLLRTNLVFAAAGHQRSSVFVVSSPSPGDGKTTVALELAKSLSISGRRVLLVDADLRKPNIAARTGLDVAIGLTSVIIGSVTLEDAVQPLPGWQLDVLTSGRIPPNPAELMEAAVHPVLEAARATYDAVVIDAAPLLPVSDTSGLATHADGVIIVARHGVTTRRQLSLARERLAPVGVDVLGLVVNAAPTLAATGYGYGYGYEYRSTPGRPAMRDAEAAESISRANGDATTSPTGPTGPTTPTGTTVGPVTPTTAHASGTHAASVHAERAG